MQVGSGAGFRWEVQNTGGVAERALGEEKLLPISIHGAWSKPSLEQRTEYHNQPYHSQEGQDSALAVEYTMTEPRPSVSSLVLYKQHPARVLAIGDKIEIELARGETKRVRDKDVQVLHPGPLRTLGELTSSRAGDDQEWLEAWELLAGTTTSLGELSELAYSQFTPASAWNLWQRVAEGLYFSGSPQEIQVRTLEEVNRDRAARDAREAEKRSWEAFIGRLKENRCEDQDRERLLEVERLALGEGEHSRVLQTLGHQETKENAHRLLVAVGYWTPSHNPYPARHRVARSEPQMAVPELPNESRRDLTGLPAYAIDDEGNLDPDDALSLDGDRIWVHVADVAALVTPGDPLDQEAAGRGSNLYAPELWVPMLPELLTQRLGLGLQEVSPALSFGFGLRDGEITDIEVVPSWVRVQRTSYQRVETQLDQAPFRDLLAITQAFRAARQARGAVELELPEVSIRVRDGVVQIRSLPRLRSRALVTDAMLMAGEAAARQAQALGLPIPYATQDAPEGLSPAPGLAAQYAARRRIKPTRLSLDPAPHGGLGLSLYSRATSPLRRYSDLLTHQQLRAALAGREPLDPAQVAQRIDLAEAGSLAIRRAERGSNQHWKLVWLKDNPNWRGEAVVVETDGSKATVLIPELAMEAKVRLSGPPKLNDRLELKTRELDLADQSAYFHARPLG